MNTKLKGIYILRGALILLGLAFLVNGIAISLMSNFNLGNVLTLLLGAVLFFWGAKFQFVSKAVPRFIRFLSAVILITVLIFATALLCCGTTDTVSYSEDAIIVLGAAVHGDTPSLVLKDRLDTAIEYHTKNPNALIIVSGGKGNQENLSEAAAMEKYLIEMGVPADIIIKEDKATSTYENFLYSKAILQERLGDNYTVCFTTTDFHIYRAGGIAKSTGFEEIYHTNSSSRWYSVLPCTLREVLAVMKFWVFGN